MSAALKAAVADNARQLILHYDQWDAAQAGWYNEPWRWTSCCPARTGPNHA